MREDGNEGKPAEMSIHTYHAHIHTLQSGNLLSCPQFGPSPFVPYLGMWERKLLAPPHLAVTEPRQIPLARINWSPSLALAR